MMNDILKVFQQIWHQNVQSTKNLSEVAKKWCTKMKIGITKLTIVGHDIYFAMK